MIVLGIQMDIAWEDPEENFRRAEAMASRAMGNQETKSEGNHGVLIGPRDVESAPSNSEAVASDSEPALIVLPEMFATGFSMRSEEVAAYADVTRTFLSELALRHSIFVLGGYAEPGLPLPANACSIFDPEGREILHYQKLHPFSLAKEHRHYQAGDRVETVEVGGVRVTPLICYDLRFPEPFRPAAPDTDLFCVIANWPAKRREAWSALLRARAIENQAYVLGVNRVGDASGEPHAGDSALVDPMGVVGAEANEFREGVVRGVVDPRSVTKIRRQLGFLYDRRPVLYRRLEEERAQDLSRS
jgi:predicted amidohydrolase